MRKTLPLAAFAAATLGVWSSSSHAQNPVSDIGAQLAVIRESTAKYHLVENAIADGYTAFPVAGNPGGIDALFVKLPAAFDGPPPTGIPGVFKLHEPEGLGYMKLPTGELRLGSVFFFQPYAPGPLHGVPPPIYPSEDPPVWLGQEPVANTTMGVWEMEVWVWVYNPNGLFDFVNPRFLDDWDTR